MTTSHDAPPVASPAQRWRLPRPAALALVSSALVLTGAAAGLPAPLYGLYQQRFGIAGIFLSPETSPRLPGALASLAPAVRIPPPVRTLFIGASSIFIACWALAGFYQALAPSLSAAELGHTGSLFAGFAVASLVAPSALGGPLSARLKPRIAMATGSVILSLAVAGVLISVGQSSTPGFFAASITAGLAFGAAFHGGMRTLMGGLAPGHRAGLLSGIYLFSYLARRSPPSWPESSSQPGACPP